MSERGVFAVDRGIWDHPMFNTGEPFSRREAWLWLLSAAAWKPMTVIRSGRPIKLARGQLVHSLRFLAEKWVWTKSKVERFLIELKTETAIGTESGTGSTVITICKYDEYQKTSLPHRDAPETAIGTRSGHDRDKEESIQNIQIDSVANATAADAASEAAVRSDSEKPVYTDSKHELWGEGVPILVSLGLTDRAARSNIGRWLRDVSDDAQQVLGAIQRARDNRIMNPIPWITRALNTGHGNGQNRQNGGRINPFKATLDGLQRGFELEASGNDEACPPPPRLLSDGRR
jgi:hypothetical protein